MSSSRNRIRGALARAAPRLRAGQLTVVHEATQEMAHRAGCIALQLLAELWHVAAVPMPGERVRRVHDPVTEAQQAVEGMGLLPRARHRARTQLGREEAELR